ncbi:LysM peptidoglycan-binding domain-containing protein [Macrococcus lamae]|uniref:LysM peptidoglycan-binding domain-containing protein n=1 Tax=Macrococcus lamae TaxID=198484 RepID=A0A4R6BWM0_9STAP|nr:LysM peptidoglycan-binding domain-containing protein [Macrococcus lamae]TDM12603.1 LysM peptidoglycan-binding domain-containing protein [Macrococcus lamae]
MKKTLFTAAAVTAITGIATVQAQASDYEVKSGDTLWAIAKENGTSVSELKELNQLSGDLIKAGDKIKVESKDFYVVKSGDTLKAIAEKFEVSTDDLKKWNNFSSEGLTVGKKIIVSEKGFNENRSQAKPAIAAAAPVKAPVEAGRTTAVRQISRTTSAVQEAPAAENNVQTATTYRTERAAAPASRTETSTANTYNRANTQSQPTYTQSQQAAPATTPVSGNVSSVANGVASGKSYVYGANSASAVDCSAFAQQVMASMGKSIPRTTYSQMAAGTQVSAPQPGDLVFFNGGSHVGVYVGNGQMVDALNPSEGIKQRPVNYVSGSVTGYYRY